MSEWMCFGFFILIILLGVGAFVDENKEWILRVIQEFRKGKINE